MKHVRIFLPNSNPCYNDLEFGRKIFLENTKNKKITNLTATVSLKNFLTQNHKTGKKVSRKKNLFWEFMVWFSSSLTLRIYTNNTMIYTHSVTRQYGQMVLEIIFVEKNCFFLGSYHVWAVLKNFLKPLMVLMAASHIERYEISGCKKTLLTVL